MPKKIFFDIETLPPEEDERDFYRVRHEEFLKKRATAESAPTFERYFRDLALDAATGRLLTVGVTIEENGRVIEHGCLGRERATGKFHLDEARTLRSFWSLIKGFDYQRDLLIGHNALDFDLLFLLRRSAIKNVEPNIRIARLDKYKTNFVYDTMWRWTNEKNRISLDVIAHAMSLPNPKSEEISGSTVYDAFLANRHPEIRDYCLRDVECVRAVYHRMNFTVPPPLPPQTAFLEKTLTTLNVTAHLTQ